MIKMSRPWKKYFQEEENDGRFFPEDDESFDAMDDTEPPPSFKPVNQKLQTQMNLTSSLRDQLKQEKMKNQRMQSYIERLQMKTKEQEPRKPWGENPKMMKEIESLKDLKQKAEDKLEVSRSNMAQWALAAKTKEQNLQNELEEVKMLRESDKVEFDKAIKKTFKMDKIIENLKDEVAFQKNLKQKAEMAASNMEVKMEDAQNRELSLRKELQEVKMQQEKEKEAFGKAIKKTNKFEKMHQLIEHLKAEVAFQQKLRHTAEMAASKMEADFAFEASDAKNREMSILDELVEVKNQRDLDKHQFDKAIQDREQKFHKELEHVRMLQKRLKEAYAEKIQDREQNYQKELEQMKTLQEKEAFGKTIQNMKDTYEEDLAKLKQEVEKVTGESALRSREWENEKLKLKDELQKEEAEKNLFNQQKTTLELTIEHMIEKMQEVIAEKVVMASKMVEMDKCMSQRQEEGALRSREWEEEKTSHIQEKSSLLKELEELRAEKEEKKNQKKWFRRMFCCSA